MLKLSLPLLLFLSSFAFATTLVPAAPAGSAQLQFLTSFMSTAQKQGSRGGSFALFGVNGAFQFVRNTDPRNYVDLDLSLNGVYYLIPTAWASADNYRQVVLQTADSPSRKAGVYILQSGFQWSSVLDGLARVDAVIRIATPDGSILPQLEYDVNSTSAHQPALGQFFPPNVSDPIAGFAPALPSHPRDNEQPVAEVLPGTWAYFNATTALNRAARPEIEAFYETYAFQNISGNLTFYGDNLVFTLNSHVFITPNNFFQTDNVTALQISAADSAYYMVQGGFRKDSASGQLTRIVSTSQIGDPAGAILPSLAYSETISPVSTPTSQYVLDVLYGATPVLIIADPHE